MNDDDTDLESLLESKESNPAIEEALRNHRRLQDELLYDRTDFLRARVDEVDKCKLQIHRLVEGHKFAISKKLKDTDLVAKRGILTPKVRLISVILTTLSFYLTFRNFMQLCAR